MQPFGRVSACAEAMKAAYGRRRQGSAKENAETALLFTAEKSAPMRENEWEALAEIAIGCTFADCRTEAPKVQRVTKKDSGLRPPSRIVGFGNLLHHML